MPTDDTTEAEPFRFQIADISPTPPPEVVAAITAALTEAWPAPTVAVPTLEIDTRWRFGQRRWRGAPIPRHAWGRAAAR